MTIEDKMSLLWNNGNAREAEISDDGTDNIPDHKIDIDPVELSDLETYREIVIGAVESELLIKRTVAAEKFETPGPLDVRQELRDCLFKTLGKQRQFSHSAAPHVAVRFHLDWNISSFHAEQQYSCKLYQVLEQAVTITGYANNVQAATCIEYVEQIWGELGTYVIHTLQQSIRDSLNPTELRSSGSLREVELSRTLSLKAEYCHKDFFMLASGVPDLIVEVGELLGWLISSLRSFPNENGLIGCRPKVIVQRYSSRLSQKQMDGMIVTRFNMTVQHERLRTNTDGSGACWTYIFRNPVIVQGYPIPRRARTDIGMETSLNIMASLANTKHLVTFGRRTFIKGFSTMLAVTEIIGSTVLWHLYHNTDGSYISYEDARVSRISGDSNSLVLDNAALRTSRHILGWCKTVSCLAGTPDANYKIGWSKLQRPNTSFAFDKVSVTAGKGLNLGVGMSIGIRDKPEHISYNDDYIATLNMISDRYFVFYDTLNRHASLLDGATTVLHLLRAFVKHSRTSLRFKDIFLFKDDDLEKADERLRGGDAAFQVLANEYNQLIPFWRKSPIQTEETTLKIGVRAEEALKFQKSFFYLRDRVLQICHVLQQITAHQDNVHSRDGVGTRIRSMPRRQLEGFDFMDVATMQGTMWPQVDYIHALGQGWVDFTRSLHCVTLFGSNFGELLRPEGRPCRTCMSNIVRRPDLLGVAMRDVLNIVEKKGDSTQTPWRIIEDIHWYPPDQIFESCQCCDVARIKRDRVQVFRPVSFPRLWRRNFRMPEIAEAGALLIGHSFKYPLRYGTQREPEEVEPENPLDDHDERPYDSGVGSSCSSKYMKDSLTSRSDSGTISSDSALYLHANEQFVDRNDPSDDDYETLEVPPRTSRSNETDLQRDRPDKSKGKGNAKSVEQQGVRDLPEHSSNEVPMRRPRPKGNFSSAWSSLTGNAPK